VTSRGIVVYGSSPLSPAAEIRILFGREMRRSVRSGKGIVLFVLTLIGAYVASRACVWIEEKQRLAEHALSTAQFIDIKRQFIEKQTGDAARAAYEANIPTSLLVFLEITIWLGPLLVALLGFDVMASELQNRSVRFWTVRMRRWSFFAGKLLGLWGVIGLFTLVLNALCGAVALSKGYVTAGQLLGWGLRFWLIAVVISGAWAAVATFISSCFKVPILALLTTFAVFFAMWLSGATGLVSRVSESSETRVLRDMRWFEYVYPNAYDSMLLSPDPGRVLQGAGILLGFVALVIAAGSIIFQRRDI
jgi:ABC-type transport system involved in multi-copper enzyme maturation permease subunit